MEDSTRVTVTAKVILRKFDVGVDHATGTPFEETEHTIVLTGEEAEKLLKEAGATNGTN